MNYHVDSGLIIHMTKVEPQLPSNFKHIVRIANVDIPGNKAICVALTKIKGVGYNLADVACLLAGVPKGEKTGNLSDVQVQRLNEVISNPSGSDIPMWFLNRRKDYETGKNTHLLTGTLSFTHENDLKRLKKIRSLRGIRHIKGLPVRGQRTKSNFRKNKGKAIAGKKKEVRK